MSSPPRTALTVLPMTRPLRLQMCLGSTISPRPGRPASRPSQWLLTPSSSTRTTTSPKMTLMSTLQSVFLKLGPPLQDKMHWFMVGELWNIIQVTTLTHCRRSLFLSRHKLSAAHRQIWLEVELCVLGEKKERTPVRETAEAP